MTEETKTTSTKPAKKAKPPALEDKPFEEFMSEHFTPSLEKALTEKGLSEVALEFKKAKIPITGYESSPECWQIIGDLGDRTFYLYFLEEDISGQKGFSCTAKGEKPSTLESFMIDERRVNLDLMVLYTLQRLNGQKWLTRN
ncbi:MAG: DUF2996 domain-containing protein [Cyanobacteria bacterium J149]|nr:MAG: DUF2996 domain-containing protein [Cyanobacteria bacterium J149]